MKDSFLLALLAQRDDCIRFAQLGDSRPLQRWAIAVSYRIQREYYGPAQANPAEVPWLCRNGNGAPAPDK